MKKITKSEVKNIIRNIVYPTNDYIGFDIVNDNIEIFYSNISNKVGYRIDGYIERWKNNEDTFQECVERTQDYMNDVIGFYNKLHLKEKV